MKILYFTDTHIRGNTPKNRKDIFIDTLERKFREIVKISYDLDVDYIIHGGDLFDRPDISISIVSRFAEILSEFRVPIYMISGNHDIYGHNPETINRTMLGLLSVLGLINIINNEKIVLEKDNVRVELSGQPYIYDIDLPENRNYYILEKKNKSIDYSIHIVHGMLLDKPFIEGIPYTLVDHIKETAADITLSGHYHRGFKTIKTGEGKYFINPGSLVRITNSLQEIERRPKIVLLDINEDIRVENIYLKSALLGSEVLDRKQIENSAFKNERMLQFKETINETMNFEKMDINEVLLQVSSSESVEEDVIKEALKRIASIQMNSLRGV